MVLGTAGVRYRVHSRRNRVHHLISSGRRVVDRYRWNLDRNRIVGATGSCIARRGGRISGGSESRFHRGGSTIWSRLTGANSGIPVPRRDLREFHIGRTVARNRRTARGRRDQVVRSVVSDIRAGHRSNDPRSILSGSAEPYHRELERLTDFCRKALRFRPMSNR